MDENQVVEPVEGSQQEQATEPQEGAVTEPQEPTFYTSEELTALTPTDIDLERVDPAYRPIVENTIRDYKTLQGDYTRKSQELAELKKTPPQPEKHFADPNEDAAFKTYMENPTEYLTALSMDVAKYDSIVPDDGVDEYRTARRWVAYLNGVKDRFLAKRLEISESRKNQELMDAKLKEQLGEETQRIIDYGVTKGFSEKELKTRPALLELVKKEYTITNASKTAPKKEVKPQPQRAATPSGEGLPPDAKVDTSKMSDSEWFNMRERERRDELKRKFGG